MMLTVKGGNFSRLEGAHHNRYQPRVPPNVVFSPVLSHLLSLLGLFHEKTTRNKQKRKHLQTSEILTYSFAAN